LSFVQRYRLAADIAIGLYRLHENGILHRDLKSLNVLLHERDGELRAKLSDFGLAALKRSLLTNEGMVGSLPWLAPEIIIGTGEYSKASDVYSLGLVLYELVTGKIPYYDLPQKNGNPNAKQIRDWVTSGERAWKFLPTDCPFELSRLIANCCAEDPKDRLAANVIVGRLEKLYSFAQESFFSLAIPKKMTEKKSLPKSHSLPSERFILPGAFRVHIRTGDALIVLAVPTEPNMPLFLFIETLTLDSKRQRQLFKLKYNQGILHEIIREEKLLNLQHYELSIQITTLERGITLQQDFQKQQGKAIAKEFVNNNSIDWNTWICALIDATNV